jgi:HSP20 family protein
MPGRASASYRNGVLRIELPKTEQARARRVEIRSG